MVSEHAAGSQAPVTGDYELLNVFGSPTGDNIAAAQGDLLPPTPRGYSWRLIEDAQ
jgi:hypothetical protein